MIVDPYKRHPVAPQVALLLADGSVVSEHGELLDLDAWPDGYRLWAAYETVYALVREGKGEALCWRGEEIKWRHRRFEDGWSQRASDAKVIRLPFSHLSVEKQLRGLATWRDWLASYGASPTGTTGSAAWSLLRARLERRLVTNAGERPPLTFTVGGRQQLGPRGPGEYRGKLLHLDLPAAYASTLSSLRYGGVWLEADGEVAGRRLESYAGTDHPVFVHSRVTVPASWFTGPLIRRPRRRPGAFSEAQVLGNVYPVGSRLTGVWTWEELEAARRSGCRVKVLGGWIHRSGWQPFLPWWDAILEGRSLGGLAGQLAKVTGNALWGRFCLDPGAGNRFIRSLGAKGRTVHRSLPARAQEWPAHDLAETVSGRVRALLWGAIEGAGDGLVLADTDGLWKLEGLAQSVEPQVVSLADAGSNPVPLSIDWRLKGEAKRLDVLGVQAYREWPRDGRRGPWVTFAGVPAERAEREFELRWKEAMVA